MLSTTALNRIVFKQLSMRHIVNRNLVITFILTLITMYSYAQGVADTWDHKIMVKSDIEELDGESMYAYSIITYDAKENTVRQLLVGELKSRTTEKVTRKKVIRAFKVKFPKNDTGSVDIVALAVAIEGSEDVNVIIGFIRGEKHVNPTEYPSADKLALEVMYNLGIRLNQAIVTAQIKTAQTDLSTLENKNLSLERQKEGLQRKISTTESKLADHEKENAAIKTNLTSEQSNVASLKDKTGAENFSTEDLEKYDTAAKYMTKLEDQLLKNEQSIVTAREKLAQTQESLQQKEEEISDISEQLNSQGDLIERLKVKYDAIN